MPRRRFALERGSPKALELRWRRGLRDFQVALDDQVWSVDRTAVVAGTSVTLPGGSSLFVQWVKRRWWSIALRDELRVDRDGVPVPGSDGDPRVVGRRAASLIAAFGMFRLLTVGLWLTIREDPRLAGMSSWWLLLAGAEGPLLMVIAVVAALGSRLAVAAAAALLALEVVLAVGISRGRLSPVGVVVTAVVIHHLYEAWKRMKPKVPTANLAAVFE